MTNKPEGKYSAHREGCPYLQGGECLNPKDPIGCIPVSLAEAIEVLIAQRDEWKRIALEAQAQVSRLSSGLHIRGWWCMHCSGFVGEEKELQSACIYCDKPKPDLQSLFDTLKS